MSSLVLQCPLCSQPFQVLAEQTGQAVQCPSCKSTVKIPTNLPVVNQPPSTVQKEPLVFGCPGCDGKFGITAEMYGQQVSCPHCQSTVMIQAPESAANPPRVQMPGVDLDVEIVRERDSTEEKTRAAAISGVSQIVTEPAGNQPPAIGDEQDTDDNQPDADPVVEKFVPQNIEHLLPPRFDVIDPERLALRGRRSVDHQVILPDGKGGLTKVDDRIVRVKYGAEEIKLVSLSSGELRRRRQIQTAIFMIGGAVILAIIFALLKKSV